MDEQKRVFLEKNRFLPLVIALLIAVFIFYISSLTFGPGNKTTNLISIFYHFLVFFWLSFFLVIALVRSRHIFLAIPAILLSLVYAVSDELHQLFVPGRACSVSDFLIDSAGIFLSTFLYLFTIRIRNK